MYNCLKDCRFKQQRRDGFSPCLVLFSFYLLSCSLMRVCSLKQVFIRIAFMFWLRTLQCRPLVNGQRFIYKYICGHLQSFRLRKSNNRCASKDSGDNSFVTRQAVGMLGPSVCLAPHLPCPSVHLRKCSHTIPCCQRQHTMINKHKHIQATPPRWQWAL